MAIKARNRFIFTIPIYLQIDFDSALQNLDDTIIYQPRDHILPVRSLATVFLRIDEWDCVLPTFLNSFDINFQRKKNNSAHGSKFCKTD
jgi:hypothetical protein